MQKIVINKTKNEAQIAILENDKLVELYVDNDDEIITGNIYSGVIKTKLKGMQAYFVDIGKEKNGYLAVTENDAEIIKGKTNILVQVKKDETDEKGAFLTLDVSLNGKYMVLLPISKEITYSKKISSADKDKAKELSSIINTRDYGMIIRSEMLNANITELEDEYKKLIQKWDDINNKYLYQKAPQLVFKQDMAEKIFNNMVKEETTKIVVNDEELYNELINYNKDYAVKVELYEDKKLNIFDLYKVETQLEKALSNRVWLKNGGELRIDKTEAMTIIDIDTSKFTGNKNMEQTARKTNLEAAVEIARQIRLRNISGIIIVDFINMKKQEDKNELIKILNEETAKDSVKTMVLGMTKLGLVEITRQKTRKSLDDIYKQDCPVCLGRGKIDSINSIVNKIEQEIKYIEQETIYDRINIEAHELVMKRLMKSDIIKDSRLKILLKASKNVKVGEWRVEKIQVNA